MRSIGVIGAGLMGAGIAHDAANHGLDVIVVDISEAQRASCLDRIRQNARVYRLAGVSTDKSALAHIRVVAEIGDLADVDFVLESMTESVAGKQEVFAAADVVCRPDVVFASNTSAIPVARLASATKRVDRVLGIHFMNPVPLQKAVEVIRGVQTSQASLDVALHLCDRMGKSSIVVNDAPGFVSNRILMLAVNEAAALVGQGVARAKDVDRVFTDCMSHKMGPLATADLIGLDTIVRTLEVLGAELDAVKYAPAPLLRELVASGKLGRKTGEGFYVYE